MFGLRFYRIDMIGFKNQRATLARSGSFFHKISVVPRRLDAMMMSA